MTDADGVIDAAVLRASAPEPVVSGGRTITTESGQ